MRSNDKYIINFLCYKPSVFSGFDKFNIILTGKLLEKGYKPVFVFFDSVADVHGFKSDFEKAGAILELFPSSSGLIELIKNINRIFNKYKPIIVHTHFENKIKIITAFFALYYKLIFIISFHSLISKYTGIEYIKQKGIIKRLSLLAYFRIVIYLSHTVFTVSKAIHHQLLAFAASGSTKVKTLYLGVNKKINRTGLEPPQYLINKRTKAVTIANISAFEEIKGIDVLLRALSILKANYKLNNFQFFHIGGLRGSDDSGIIYRNKIVSLVKMLNIENNVVWLGQISNASQVLQYFDIYVHPSRMEGIGVANMEAAACSLPIVASNIGGIPEIVHHDVNGFLFESENAEQLAGFLSRLILDESLRKKMGAESYRLAEKDFNIEKQTQILADYYMSAAQSKLRV